MINLKFAEKCAGSSKFSHWFSPQTRNEHGMKTRSQNSSSYAQVQARTKVFAQSPIAYLTNLLIANS